MMYSEFVEISGQQVSYKAYVEKFEPMYTALDVDKHEFIQFMMPTIKEVAKRERKAREEEERRNQKLVFVSDGSKTPNGCYYIGGYFKLTGIDIRTGKVTLRELTDREMKAEVIPHWDAFMNSRYDFTPEQVKVIK